MVERLTWDHDHAEKAVECVVTRYTIHEGQMILLYEGKQVGSTLPYEGRITLGLTLGEQLIAGSYELNGSQEKFLLVGKFADERFDSFEGLWTEGNWTANFSF